MEVDRALDCRYVGQGYELRVPLDGAVHRRGARGVPPPARARVRHAFGDPIEIVNLASRRSAGGRRSSELPVAGRRPDEALVGESEGTAASTASCSALHDAPLDRDALPLGEPVAGPAVVFQLDTTIVVPPGWAAAPTPPATCS